jgi:putative pyruvate formate lyase activating enzyme
MEQQAELKNCRVCPRNCGINRYESTGYCRSGHNLKINIWQKHFGEEPFISGDQGSGTIFFSGCNLCCRFCQNYLISQQDFGEEYTVEQVMEIMLQLQSQGVHNINLVTPTHYSVQLKEAIIMAKKQGLTIPIVWNSNSYEKVETLRSLEGLIDIYLADFKYGDNAKAARYSAAISYWETAIKALCEMHRQVGNIKLDAHKIATGGLAVRILVLPENINSTEIVLRWLRENLGTAIYISLMSQYYPAWQALNIPELSRSLNNAEYETALELVEKYGFENCLIQELEPTPEWTPDFNKPY